MYGARRDPEGFGDIEKLSFSSHGSNPAVKDAPMPAIAMSLYMEDSVL